MDIILYNATPSHLKILALAIAYFDLNVKNVYRF